MPIFQLGTRCSKENTNPIARDRARRNVEYAEPAAIDKLGLFYGARPCSGKQFSWSDMIVLLGFEHDEHAPHPKGSEIVTAFRASLNACAQTGHCYLVPARLSFPHERKANSDYAQRVIFEERR